MMRGLSVWSASLCLLAGCFYDFSNPPARINTECVGAAEGKACDDRNACTETDVCDGAGNCRGAAKVCSTPPGPECIGDDAIYQTYQSAGLCRTSDGACVYAPQQFACPNCTEACLSPCQTMECPPLAGGCLSGSCVPGPPASCSYAQVADDTQCVTGGDFGLCQNGVCTKSCNGPSDCDDGDPCTDDTCVNNFCEKSFNTADCGTCGVCNGAGTCTYDETQDTDCGDAGCGFCTGLGTCGRSDSGTACDTCMTCDDTGLCNEPTPMNEQGPFCDDAATACSQADVCDGAGECLPRHLDNTTACDTCMLCDGAGECALPVANGTPGPNCDAAATSCSLADVCDGAGTCIIGNLDAGSDCGVCGECNGAGTCVYDETQDADCGNSTTCGVCQSLGVCSHANASTYCGTCMQCNGAGQCSNQISAGQRGNCSACQTCNAAAACVQVATNSQGACPTCQQCNSGGVCVNRANGQQPGCNSDICRRCESGACVGKLWTCPFSEEDCGNICDNQASCNACCQEYGSSFTCQ